LRETAQQVVPQDLTHEVVGQRDPAGRDEVRDHHPPEFQRCHDAGPAAVEGGNAPQHAQVLDDDEHDIDDRQGADRRDDADPLRRREHDALGACVEWPEDLAVGEPGEIARIAHISLVLAEAGNAPANVRPP